MLFNIARKNVEPDVALLEMSGRISMGSDSQKIEGGLTELIKEDIKKVVFDLKDVIYLDSSGIGILLMCYAKLKKAGGSLHISGARGIVEETLRHASVNRIVPLYPTSAEAVSSFKPV
jgi:anti-sigma B factor antagonist